MILIVWNDREEDGFRTIPGRIIFGDIENLSGRACALFHPHPDIGSQSHAGESGRRIGIRIYPGREAIQVSGADGIAGPLIEAVPALEVSGGVKVPPAGTIDIGRAFQRAIAGDGEARPVRAG